MKIINTSRTKRRISESRVKSNRNSKPVGIKYTKRCPRKLSESSGSIKGLDRDKLTCSTIVEFTPSKMDKKLRVINIETRNTPNAGLKPSKLQKGIITIGIDNYKNSVADTSDVTAKISTRQSAVISQLKTISEGITKRNAIQESIISKYPIVTYLSSNDIDRFSKLSTIKKNEIVGKVNESGVTDPNIVCALLEQAIAGKNVNNAEPLWLSAAPAKYKSLYEASSPEIRRMIQAKTEFVNLDTRDQIEDFWQRTNLDKRQTAVLLNESVISGHTVNSSKVSENAYDNMIALVGNSLKEAYSR